jgi:hypothetical protein
MCRIAGIVKGQYSGNDTRRTAGGFQNTNGDKVSNRLRFLELANQTHKRRDFPRNYEISDNGFDNVAFVFCQWHEHIVTSIKPLLYGVYYVSLQLRPKQLPQIVLPRDLWFTQAKPRTALCDHKEPTMKF